MFILTFCNFLKNLLSFGIIPNELFIAIGKTGHPDFRAILATPVCSLMIFFPSSIVPSGNIATNFPFFKYLTELLTTQLLLPLGVQISSKYFTKNLDLVGGLNKPS